MVYAASFLLAALAASAVAPSPAPLTGTWVEQGPLTTFRFEPCGAATCGILLDSPYIKADPAKQDTNNPDPALRGHTLKGLTVLQDLRPVGAGWSGRIYFPSRGLSYAVSLTSIDIKTVKMTVCLTPDDCHDAILDRQPD
jgi:uncharacterized protein (DUF2147 family)